MPIWEIRVKTVHEDFWPLFNVLFLAVVAVGWLVWVARCGTSEKRLSRPLVRFMRSFAVIFAFGCAVFFVGASGPFSEYLLHVGRTVFPNNEARKLEFSQFEGRGMRIVIVNRRLMDANGSGPIRNVDIVSSSFFWEPLCVYIALVLASPITQSRRARAVFFGAFGLQVMMFSVVAFAIWNNSTEVGLVSLSPFMKGIANSAEESLETAMFAAVPLLVWALLACRRADFLRNAKTDKQ
jgi:hypothetical protein